MPTPEKPNQCACPNCRCAVDPNKIYERDGKAYCCQACADFHPAGKPCQAQDCHCEQTIRTQQRTVSDSQLDQAIEESFPASDPISP
jgi:hypothetical protein